MRVQGKILAAALVLGMWPGIVGAVEKTDFTLKNTEDLFEVCTTPTSNALRDKAVHYCVGFLVGAVSYHNAMSEHKDMKRLTCYPEGTTREQGALVFIDWARANQNDSKLMGEAPVLGLMRALQAKWPCK